MPKNNFEKVAIIGSGATAVYLLKHLWDNAALLSSYIKEIYIFEKSPVTGMGMPYNPRTTDRYNLSNISSKELPPLFISFADWLRSQDTSVLEDFNIFDEEISESEVYSRLALGQFLNSQYQAVIEKLKNHHIAVHQFPGSVVTDIKDLPDKNKVKIFCKEENPCEFDKVIIATGHVWNEKDYPKAGYFASPWPIFKILPSANSHYDFTVGTLGASLSAFDVITSLFHRHGKFTKEPGCLAFRPHPEAEKFKMVMHATQGWLPHLQYEQQEPMREIYRHVDRDSLLSLLDDDGFLRIEKYFDQVCRPALKKAFEKNDLKEEAALLSQPAFGFSEFVAHMTNLHEYADAFEGMRKEMAEARKSAANKKPIYWKEVMDDLMYTLNFHAELMPAEDHLLFRAEVMPFLMNVIAALPLSSAAILLALYDAGKIDIAAGRVQLPELSDSHESTTIRIENNEKDKPVSYKMFINCGGQKAIELDEYPFQTLVKDGTLRKARAIFKDQNKVGDLREEQKEQLLHKDGQYYYHTGGIEVDASYRLIGQDGKPNGRIYDVAFTHASGVRPYSYGLQACSATTQILVEAWIKSLQEASEIEGDVIDISELYENKEEL